MDFINYTMPLIRGDLNVKKLLLISIIPDIIKKITDILLKDIHLNKLFTNYLQKFLIFLNLKKQEYTLEIIGSYNSIYPSAIKTYLSKNNIKIKNTFIQDDEIQFYNETIEITDNISLIINKNEKKENVYKFTAYKKDILDDILDELKNLNDPIKSKDKDKHLFYYIGYYVEQNQQNQNLRSYNEKNEKNEKNDNKNKKVINGYIEFNDYKLNNRKTFDTLFILNKKYIMNFIDDFKFNKGIYKHSNIDHKLGILLYGPPGTGKTSFIKCMSNYFNRNIISVPLGQIKTNKMFFDFIMNSSKKVSSISGYCCHTLKFSDVIYIIEDVDAIKSVIKKRSNDDDLIKDYTDIKEDEYEDQLNLAGILNTLDGVIDTPDRIIIFTTNHIDHIDPALLRPGRIDLKIKLDFLQPNIAIEMIQFYYNDFIDIDSKFFNFFKDNNITPAELEKHIKASNSLEQLYINLTS